MPHTLKHLQEEINATKQELEFAKGLEGGRKKTAVTGLEKKLKSLNDSLPGVSNRENEAKLRRIRKYDSPDRYDDTALGATPPRLEYHKEQERVGPEQLPKKAGGIPAKVDQHSGTENIRGNYKTLEQTPKPMPPTGTKDKWPAKVDTYRDETV
jgi:hypothetical protein